jgi:hypothetical protein
MIDNRLLKSQFGRSPFSFWEKEICVKRPLTSSIAIPRSGRVT